MNNFDPIAPVYDHLAKLVFGKTLEKAQSHFLALIPPNKHILILGGGTGKILIDILKCTSNSSITYQESSLKMILLSKARLQKYFPKYVSKVNFVHTADFSSLETVRFDVIVTPFVLDLFDNEEIGYVFEKLHKSLKPSGLWIWTDFFTPNNKYRWLAKILLGTMYIFFRLVSNISANQLPDVFLYFQTHHYQLQYQASFLRGIVQTRVYCKINDNI